MDHNRWPKRTSESTTGEREMRQFWFGAGWDDLSLIMGNHVATPVGERCLKCGRPIEADDQGLLIGMAAEVEAHIAPGPLHLSCLGPQPAVCPSPSD